VGPTSSPADAQAGCVALRSAIGPSPPEPRCGGEPVGRRQPMRGSALPEREFRATWLPRISAATKIWRRPTVCY